jgi:hypothetical protein
MVESFRALIDRFGIAEFAEVVGVTYGAAKQMRRRNWVGAEYWQPALKEAARREWHDISAERLAEIAAKIGEAPPERRADITVEASAA